MKNVPSVKPFLDSPPRPPLVNCTRDVAVSRHRRLRRIADADGVREEREGGRDQGHALDRE